MSRGGGLDQLSKLVRGVVLRHVMHVDHHRGDIRVAHEHLHVQQREHLNRQRPERVAQIVEPHGRQAGVLERCLGPAAQPIVGQELAHIVDEDVIAVASTRGNAQGQGAIRSVVTALPPMARVSRMGAALTRRCGQGAQNAT